MATATDDSVINHRLCFPISAILIDFSKFNFPREIWFSKPNAEIVCKLLVLLPIILFGAIGNLLLLNIIIVNRALHSSTNYILANMIAADTLTVIFCPAAFICTDFFQNYLLGFLGCKFDGFLQVTFLLTAVFNMCVVSYDRLTAIVLPLEQRITMRSAKMTMFLTWMVGLTISIPFAIYRNYKERHWKNFVEKYCVENITILSVYWHIILVLLVLCPLIVMILCYSVIFWKLDRYEQKVLKRENSITISYKRRVARMLFIIVTIFILLHIPFTVLIFLRTKLLKTAIMNQLTGKIYLLSWFAHFCLFANAAINPIVYGLTNDNFRRAYHQTPIIPKQFGQFWLNFVKKFKYKRNAVKREKVDIQPIIYRPTQETMLNGSTIKPITQSVPSTPHTRSNH